MRGRGPGVEGGFTLIEVVIAVALLAVGLLAVTTAQVQAINYAARSKHLTRAVHLAQEQMEAFNSMPTASLPATGTDPANPIDPDPNDGDFMTFTRSWVIEADTPSAGITRITVNIGWVDEHGINRTTSLQSFKAF
jgi:prepilin-type N-terminal cleavage/methylation domain-containing protein